MHPEQVQHAAQILWKCWSEHTRIDVLPAECRPLRREDGYRVQAEVARISGQQTYGWKIAATSTAGQRHIGVDGPLAGRLLSKRVLEPQVKVPLEGNIMRVAEAEFAFRMGSDLPPRDQPYSVDEVMTAVEALHPAIEVPDSRYRDFARVGAAPLIADNACAAWFVPGIETAAPWYERNLAEHTVTVTLNGRIAGEGTGANVLGDPRVALTWIANELSTCGEGLRAGQVVTTGTCVAPVEIAAGDLVLAEFGEFGKVAIRVG
ncbi:MAG TPA: fumarylacetoacetate hydrolase family protein [Burkholderiales bacterium]|nr:fumarylacetoacetate hydrolase family protein [Burkholderiales bacterium]